MPLRIQQIPTSRWQAHSKDSIEGGTPSARGMTPGPGDNAETQRDAPDRGHLALARRAAPYLHAIAATWESPLFPARPRPGGRGGGGVVARIQQTPKLPMESALQRPNRGRDALAPGDNAGAGGRRGSRGTTPEPGDDAGAGGRRRGRGTTPGPGDDAGAGGQRRDPAGRPGARASRPRTARSAVSLCQPNC